MKKVLVLAYAISPYRGSEYSVSWNYIINMSKENELVVLYGVSGNHLGDINELENHIKINPIKNVRFIPIIPNKETEKLNSLNKKGIFVYSFYLAFHSWHKQVYEFAKELIKKEYFDLIHYLTPIGYREPGYLWKFNLPYIWGPIGGTQSIPIKLVSILSISDKIKLLLRKTVNSVQFRFKPRLAKAIKNSDALIASTTFDQNNFKRIYGCETYYLPENGILGSITNEPVFIDKEKKLNIIWVGRIDGAKALVLLLEALRKMMFANKVNLNVVGSGPLKDEMMSFAKNHGIDNFITWHDTVPREKVFELFSKSHLHIITSLTEANTTVIWEAMASGIPTISLDHCGMHDTICEKCGIKIPIKSFNQVTEDLAVSIDNLIMNPEKINALSRGVIECAQKYTWDKRVEFFNEMYEKAIDNFKSRKR